MATATTKALTTSAIRIRDVRRTSTLLLVLGLALAARASRAAPPAPILVELFTSEGCSSCPPADALLARLIATQPMEGAEIVGLGQHVDYWDHLGWKDRFSSAELTNRQQLYQGRFGTESIYTPQMVVDGRVELVGSDAGAARRAIERSMRSPHGVVRIDFQEGEPQRVALHLTVSDLPPLARGDRADIVVAITEDGLRTDVKRGENHGRALTHAAVVRHMAAIGQVADGMTSGSARVEIPLGAGWQRDRLRVVAFVQERRGRAILASASVPLENARP
jgi:hypothetical protein